MAGLVAGTMLRGMFEERLQGIIQEVKERNDLILFVDEAHTIIGAGAEVFNDVAPYTVVQAPEIDLRIRERKKPQS